MDKMIMLSDVAKIIRESNNISIYTHINTDCDALGSSLALREALKQMGKNADVYVNSNFPNNFKFYGDLSFVNHKTVEGKYDLAICLDSATEGRLGKYKFTYRKGVKNTLAIDHHQLSNENFCKVNFVKEASSTSEILFELLISMKVKLTKYICKCLISGILTDTGRFTHSIKPKTLFVVSKLLKYGELKMEEITTPLFNSMTFEVFNLMQLAYDKIEFYSDKRLAMIMFSNEDFKKTSTTINDVDAFPDIPLQLECVKFAILASEDDKGYFRVSFRSKGEISAKDVAESFGGGGHLNASGCKIFGTFEEVKEKLLSNSLEILGWKK
ncbi:MAG: bifunctional oligoribonuclease/PAP phosphatase NrnA [Clostridia bacterium]|nr:bifunctional oligoribonuclease/PAP phosphatase NrnA [Clostridia bacterium]